MGTKKTLSDSEISINLYKIVFSHTAPKDTKNGIMSYLLAEDKNIVYNYIDIEYNCGCWSDQENEKRKYHLYNDECDVIGTETFKEKIIRLNGEINDDDYVFSDAYYGITLYGWELVQLDIDVNLSSVQLLIRWGILKWV